MQTTRRSVAIRDKRASQLATEDDDEVVILRGRKVAARFRELEVELAPDAPADLLKRMGHSLRAAGAQPVPQVPKLTHALGPDATEPWDLAPVALAERPPIREVVSRRLVVPVATFIDAHAALVLDEEPLAVRAVQGRRASPRHHAGAVRVRRARGAATRGPRPGGADRGARPARRRRGARRRAAPHRRRVDRPLSAFAAGVLVGVERAGFGARLDAVELAAARLERKGRWNWLD